MTIETKFNVGDFVYHLRYGKIAKNKVTSIEFKKDDDLHVVPIIWYGIFDNGNKREDQIFATREDLINSL